MTKRAGSSNVYKRGANFSQKEPSLSLACSKDTNGTMASSTHSRRQGIFWLLTVPFPSEICESLAGGNLPSELCWAKGQQEEGAETGYRHYQLIVGFSKKVSLASVKSLFGTTCHGELSRSEAAEAYCHKEETRVGEPFEVGAKPFRRNSKTDWDGVWKSAQSGDLESVPAYVRVLSYRSLRAIASDYSTCEGIEKSVEVFWGSTGTGKSRRAWDEAGISAYAKCPRSKFWDGYQNQEHVVVDEFRGGIDVAHLLRWTDRYPVRVEVKGSSRPLNAKRIWFTSNVNPELWYPDLDPATLDALLRRLTITHFP